MKTTTTIQKLAMLLLIAVLGLNEIIAQEYPSTVIDVKGSRYGDTMWLFTVEGTTDSYDNGWDGYKILGSSLAPQIFALDANNVKYQVMTSSNVHGTRIGFIPGEDNVYTLNFTHYSVNLAYQQLYLVDKLKNQTVDIYAQGCIYNFDCSAGDIEDRFTVITYKETPVVVVTDPVVVVPEIPVISDPIQEVIPEAVVKTIKVFTTSNMVVVDNPYDIAGKARIIDAKTGRQVKKFDVNPNSITTLKARVKSGTYIVSVLVGTIETNVTVIL